MGANPGPSLDRHEARRRAFELIRDLQSGDPRAAEEMTVLLETAERRGHVEVLRLVLFGRVVEAWVGNRLALRPAVQAFLTRCERDGDQVLTALALALRALTASAGSDPAEFADGTADLARATVLLETASGGASERIAAHTGCGMAFVDRWLWELGDREYRQALGLAGEEDDDALDVVLAPVVFNRAEAKVAWASALRQFGDTAAVTKLWRGWASDMEIADAFAMPLAWRTEMTALGLLMSAIADQPVTDEAASVLAKLVKDPILERDTVGHLKLAIALNCHSERGADAAAIAEEAVAAIDPDTMPHMYNLALHLAAEIDEQAGHGAGLRCARQQFAQHWAARLANLGAMQLRIDTERLSLERDTLRREATHDDLTGIGNRRALSSYLANLHERGVNRVALLMIDLDGLKGVNDKYGHRAGDAALRRVAAVLEAKVRRGDLAVRLGGDEFEVVLAGVELDVARARAQDLLAEVQMVPWPSVVPGLEVSVSVGLAAGPISALEQLNVRADTALYAAKAAGGNTVVAG